MSGIANLSPADAERTIGLTTTVPAEIIFAAGLRPLDLNNVFITSGCAAALVEEAEHNGFPRNSCAWNKGIYAAARALGLRRVAAVVQRLGRFRRIVIHIAMVRSRRLTKSILKKRSNYAWNGVSARLNFTS